jgi:hypothetical protein
MPRNESISVQELDRLLELDGWRARDPAMVHPALGYAVDELKDNDSHLLQTRAHEGSICHAVANYLSEWFKSHTPGFKWDVDCEYNRYGSGERVKRARVEGQEPTMSGRDPSVRPDIIVHKRTTADNLMVIEAKWIGDRVTSRQLGDIWRDIARLQRFAEPDSAGQWFGYRYCIFLALKRTQPSVAVETFVHTSQFS